jgi:uncharacterized membrane protein YadS
MSNKFNTIMYVVTMVASFLNAYFAYKENNIDATIAWIVAAGFSGGASGAYMKLHDLENKEEDDK